MVLQLAGWGFEGDGALIVELREWLGTNQHVC